MKKFLALFLMTIMLLGSVSFAETYEPFVSYTGSGWMLNASANYDDALYKWFTEKFNMEWIPYFTDNATNDEKVNLLVNTSSMPDGLMTKSFSYDTYLEWVDQGLLAPLPDGWQEKYPNIYDMLQSTNILDYITIDGQVYCIPHSVFYNFLHMDIPVEHTTIYYRKDWAEKLGMTDLFADHIVKVGDLMAYCKAAVEANLGDNGKTVGVTCNNTKYIIRLLADRLSYDYSKFARTENGYVWSPEMPGMVEVIKELRAHYQAGSIDPDFYLGNGRDTFFSGTAAALFDTGSANSSSFFQSFVNAHTELVDELDALQAENPSAQYFDTSVMDIVGYATLAQDDGIIHANETTNYWSVSLYSPDIDPVVFDRILALTDYVCTPEGELVSKIGIPGVDWEWVVENESINQLPNENGEYNNYDSRNMLTQLALNSDEISMLKASNPPQFLEFIRKAYADKNAGIVRPYDYDYSFFTSQAKAEYSVDIPAEIISLIVDGSLDIDTEWAAFIAENASMVDPVIADLNAAFYPDLAK